MFSPLYPNSRDFLNQNGANFSTTFTHRIVRQIAMNLYDKQKEIEDAERLAIDIKKEDLPLQPS